MKRGTQIAMVAAAGLLTWAAFGADSPAPTPAAPTPAAPVDYSLDASWLCRPGHNAACTADFDATIVAANGSERVERWHAARHPPIDCFYVYPTVSADKQSNSDLVPAADAEIAMTRQQVGRYASVCRLFVPLYRQITLSVMRGEVPPGDRALAYGDVKAAWEAYLRHDNHGRGVVLIGHSQGAGIVRELLRQEIDGKPEQRLIVSALIAGGNVQVPEGKDVGGDFQHMPLCRTASQTGCVITFASFRDTDPPDAHTMFGKSKEPGLVAACTNPAALGGGAGALDAYLSADFNTPPYHTQPGMTPQPPWVAGGKPVTTPYVKVPGLLTAECRRNAYATFLGIALHADPAEPRVHDIKGV